MMNRLPPFKLERYFADYEFKARYLLSASDCEPLTLAELIGLADAECLTRWEQLSLGYTESQGLPALRQEVGRFYPALTADDVIILAPEEGIFIAMTTLLEPGDHVITISPAYQSLHSIARTIGCEVTSWSITPAADGWSLDIGKLERSINPKTRMLIINFPHNPTGYLSSHSELQAIVDLASRYGLYLFSDEMYRCLEYDVAQQLPPVCDIYERGISLSGMSKSFSLPGLRIGWLATRNRDLVSRWLSLKDYTTICSSGPSEVLALMGLRAQAAIIARNLAIIRHNLAEVDHFITEFANLFQWRKPLAGSVAFPQWMGTLPVDQFCQMALDRQGVMIVPGDIFDVPGGFFRMGLGRRNFGEALDQVRTCVRIM